MVRSAEARILARKLESKASRGEWVELESFLPKAFEAGTADAAVTYYRSRVPKLVQELKMAGLPVELSRDGKRIRHELIFLNPRQEELRCRVGFELLRHGDWHGKDDFLKLTGHEDHQKVIQVMGASGYAIERRETRGTMEYRLTSAVPGEPRARAFKTPTGGARERLYALDSHTCAICGTRQESRNLRPDHRIPAQIAGSPDQFRGDDWMEEYQTLCVTCNYEKREACKRCPNWTTKDPSVCAVCFWARPDNFEHVATEHRAATDVIVWSDESRELRETLRKRARDEGISIGELLVRIARKEPAESEEHNVQK